MPYSAGLRCAMPCVRAGVHAAAAAKASEGSRDSSSRIICSAKIQNALEQRLHCTAAAVHADKDGAER